MGRESRDGRWRIGEGKDLGNGGIKEYLVNVEKKMEEWRVLLMKG